MCFKHDNHPLQSKEFLNYNLHDIGIYDIRALLEFVLNQTSESTISYVGHSQGAGTLLILLSTMPEFNSYINEAHLLTPAVFLKEAKSPILTLSAKYHKFTNVTEILFEKVRRTTEIFISHRQCTIISRKLISHRSLKLLRTSTRFRRMNKISSELGLYTINSPAGL